MSAYGDPVALLVGGTIVQLWSFTLILRCILCASAVCRNIASKLIALIGHKY